MFLNHWGYAIEINLASVTRPFDKLRQAFMSLLRKSSLKGEINPALLLSLRKAS